MLFVSTASGEKSASSLSEDSEQNDRSQIALLPTDRSIREQVTLPMEEPLFPLEGSPERPGSRESHVPLGDFKHRMKPRVNFFAEWEPQTDGLTISSYDMSIRQPLFPLFGPPPPSITSGYSLTQIAAPADLDLPSNLHEFSLGLGWMRKIKQNWMLRMMISGVFASDLINTNSDAWQIRGGLFAMYRPNERSNYALGAMATGRDDIPVLPAIGAIWNPTPQLKINLMMPRPRISLLLSDNGQYQQWGYIGGGISGGAWAYERASGSGERLNYREWRLVLGWEKVKRQSPGSFHSNGLKLNAEIGYVFGRKFEFQNGAPDISIDDTLLIRSGISF